MPEAYDPKTITQHPVPPVRQLENGYSQRDWRLELVSPVNTRALGDISPILSDGVIQIDAKIINPSVLDLVVTASPKVASHKVWEATFRAMLLVERNLGEIIHIEGQPRHEWKVQFVISEHAGALDKDKTPLMLMAEKGDLVAVKDILNVESKSYIDEISPSGRTALSYAASRGHFEVMMELLARGANVNITGECTILEAGTLGSIEIVKSLLDAGADVNARNRYDGTALMAAAANGKGSIVELLISKGADSCAKDSKNETALQKAAKSVLMRLEHSQNQQCRPQVAFTGLSRCLVQSRSVPILCGSI